MIQQVKEEYARIVKEITIQPVQYYGLISVVFDPTDLTKSLIEYQTNVDPRMAIIVLESVMQKLKQDLIDNNKN